MDNNDAPVRVGRTVTVPVQRPEPVVYSSLRYAGALAARLGNHVINAHYLAGAGTPGAHPNTVYADAVPELAAVVRAQVAREAWHLWRRVRREVLAGRQSLASYRADRALHIRHDGVLLRESPGKGVMVRLRILTPPAPFHELHVWPAALAKDHYLSATLAKLASGEYKLGYAGLRWDRHHRLTLRLSYRKEAPPAEQRAGECRAELVCAAETWLRCAGRALSLGDYVHRLVTVKASFGAIQRRIRIDLGRARRRNKMRRVMAAAPDFTTWSRGPLHELSRGIIEWSVARGAAGLTMSVTDLAPDLPWSRLAELLAYKCVERGLVFEQSIQSAAAEQRTVEDAIKTIKRGVVRDLREAREVLRDVS